MSATIEQALAAMAERGEQGRSSFEGFDIDLGHALAARVAQGIPLSDKQRGAGYRLLRKYTEALALLGIDYAALVAPNGQAQAEAVALPPSGVSIFCQDAKIVVKGSKFADRETYASIPGSYWFKSRQVWTYPRTPTSAKNISERLAHLRPEVSEGFRALVAEATDLRAHAAIKDAAELPPIPGEVMNSWLHQRRAYHFAAKLPGAILHLGLGTGKTKIMIDLLRESGAQRILIVAPERVIDVHPKQFRLHGPEHLWHVVNGKQTSRTGKRSLMSIKDRTRAFDAALNDCRCGKAHVLITNYASLAHEPFASWALEQRFDYVVYDEAHRLKSVTGVWSKWAAKMYKQSARRLALSGTLMSQTPLDAFSVFRAIDPDVFGKSMIAHERRYALKGGFEGREFLGMNPNTIDEFRERLHSIMVVCGEEVLDLPEQLPDITYACQLGPAAARAYKSIDEELYALLRTMDETEAVSAPNVLVKMLRLQQICGGAVHAESGNYVEIDTAKATLLGEVLDDIPTDEPVIVFCRFIHDLDAVKRTAEKMGRTYAELSGRRDDALTSDATLAEGVQVAAVQIQSGGTGVDMTRSRHGIYYSLGFSLSDYTQSRARLHRPGQEHHVRFVHLVASGTIDEQVYEALADRKSIIEYAIAERKRRE